MPDTDTTYLGIVITLEVIHMESASYLFIGGLEKTPGLSAFRITAKGHLEHVQSMADSEGIFTDGIKRQNPGNQKNRRRRKHRYQRSEQRICKCFIKGQLGRNPLRKVKVGEGARRLKQRIDN